MKQEIIHIMMLVGMFVSIGLLSFTVIILIKNSEEIKTDGVTYAINKYNFSSCTCYNEKGISIEFNSTGPKPTIRDISSEIPYYSSPEQLMNFTFGGN